MSNETLLELQNRVYNQNKELGWHDKPRSFNTFVCLFHSELSEATEGLRKNLMDDHLPQYPMFQVEMADYIIRVLDWCGSAGIDACEVLVDKDSEYSETAIIAHCHNATSKSFERMLNGKVKSAHRYLMYGVHMAIHAIGDDAFEIINEKIEYNKHRADHKRENRAKDGGKKF